MTYGASPSEWSHFDLMLGLTEDLLPVVCTPNLPISQNSTLKSYGKVPSIIANGAVVGLAKWTSRVSTDADIDTWSANPNYGICLQTRRVRAIDVDVEDAGYAARVRRAILAWRPELVWPVRTRANSAKFLLLFDMEGDHGKQRLTTPHGIVEFLANGNQCLVGGCHPSGARYLWTPDARTRGATAGGGDLTRPHRLQSRETGVLPSHLPRLTADDWADLRDTLELIFAAPGEAWSEPSRTKTRLESLDGGTEGPRVVDPVTTYLAERGLARRTMGDGRVHVVCPWESDHTTLSDDSATTYFPAGTGGYQQGHFDCRHAHCSGRTDQDFLDAIGYTTDGFDTITDQDEIEVQRAFDLKRRDELIAAGGSPISGPRLTRDKSGVLWTINNVVEALRHADFGGLLISYDRFIDQIVVSERTATNEPGPLRLLDDNDYTRFAMRCLRRGFKTSGYPTQMIRDGFRAVAMERAVDSAMDWLNALPEWDGVPRVDSFCVRYLGAESTPYARSVSRYWWTAHAGRILDPGCQADMAIVLISEQGTGKTSAVRAIAPYPEWFCELSLADRDADLSRAMRGKVVGEIAELRGLSGRESEAIKAWVSRRTESWVPKYREQQHTFLRRLVVIGTANNDEFLSDETGHRRWLPLNVGKRIKVDDIIRDRNQLWAEAASIWRREGVTWKEAQTLATAEHAHFEVRDSWEEAVVKWLNEEGLGGGRPSDLEFLTIAQVLEGALRLDPNKQQLRDQHRIGRVMKQLGYEKHVTRQGDRLVKAWWKGSKKSWNW